MTYEVILSFEAVEDALRITMASGAKSQVLQASKRIQEALKSDPAAEGEFLSEGLYFIDREPLRAFFHNRRARNDCGDRQRQESIKVRERYA